MVGRQTLVACSVHLAVHSQMAMDSQNPLQRVLMVTLSMVMALQQLRITTTFVCMLMLPERYLKEECSMETTYRFVFVF